MIVFRAPKGWTGPTEWANKPIEKSFRAHQVPIPVDQTDMTHVDALLDWLKSYGPEELFDENGTVKPEIKAIAPTGTKRMAMNPIVNGGVNPRALKLPDWKDYTFGNSTPGKVEGQDMIEFGKWARDVIKLNPDNFRVFGPDETMSNRLNHLFDATNRQWLEEIKTPNDEFMAPAGRVIDSQLSEHQAEGWLEGYVLTGRHGFFSSYEASCVWLTQCLPNTSSGLGKQTNKAGARSIRHSILWIHQLHSNKTITATPTRIRAYLVT